MRGIKSRRIELTSPYGTIAYDGNNCTHRQDDSNSLDMNQLNLTNNNNHNNDNNNTNNNNNNNNNNRNNNNLANTDQPSHQ